MHTAMVTCNIKHVSRDTVDGLVSKIVTLWPQAGPGETVRGQTEGGASRGQVQDCADAASSAAPRSQPAASASSRDSGGAAPASASSGCALALSGSSSAAGNQAVDAGLQAIFEQPYPDSPGASAAPSHSGGAGEKRVADSPPAANVRVHKAQAQAVLLSSAPAAATVGQHATMGGHVPLHPSAQPSSAGPAKHAPAQRQPPAASPASPLAAGPAGSGAGAFGAQHLARVLCAAFPSMAAMKRLVQDLKAKSDAFRPVHLSSQANGGAYTREQIAARIVECRPPQVDSAGLLLSWLTVCVTPKPF